MKGAGQRKRRAPLIGIAILTAAFFAMVVASFLLHDPKNVPGNLPESDKWEIVRLTRCKTFTQAAVDLSRGEFKRCLRGLQVLPKQQINELRKMSDGTYRAYVVVFSEKEPDGFYAWWRHQLIETNGDWVIIRSH